MEEAKYDLVVMSDSDVRVDPDYLKTVVPPFADPQVGAVTTFCRCITGGGVAAELDALGMYLDSAPAALVARMLEGKMQFAFGWTMATTKRHLSEIGGWEAMANHHSDDFELGNRIARRGYTVYVARSSLPRKERKTLSFAKRKPDDGWRYARHKFQYGQFKKHSLKESGWGNFCRSRIFSARSSIF